MNASFPLIKLQLRLIHQTLTDWSSFCREVTYEYTMLLVYSSTKGEARRIWAHGRN
ncbi:Uncharacterized protein FWK35_00006394 [Aphis craccivora]|uniref:Uncharacterized protein n=1 Tax=Aphis craccivora TaxID=307492 RepID=A0A6G0ZND0_APHCR|nr:Uncharacterized protein FWK35_00006394 [Aphis craccivora]